MECNSYTADFRANTYFIVYRDRKDWIVELLKNAC